MDKELREILKRDVMKKEEKLDDEEKEMVHKISVLLGTHLGKVCQIIEDMKTVDKNFSDALLLSSLLSLLSGSRGNTDEMLKVIDRMRKEVIDLDTKLNKGTKNNKRKK